MPESSPFAKVEATRGYGAEVLLRGAGYAEAADATEQIAALRAAGYREDDGMSLRGRRFVRP